MKPSNLQIPRTLAECTFTVGYTQEGPRPYDLEDKVVMAGCAVTIVALVLIFLFV